MDNILKMNNVFKINNVLGKLKRAVSINKPSILK